MEHVGAQLFMPSAITLDSYSESLLPICATKPLWMQNRRKYGPRLWNALWHQSHFLRFCNLRIWHCPEQGQNTERLERLIPTMAIAMYWAVSSGAADENTVAQRDVKRGVKNPDDPCVRSSNKGYAFYVAFFIGRAKIRKLCDVWVCERG